MSKSTVAIVFSVLALVGSCVSGVLTFVAWRSSQATILALQTAIDALSYRDAHGKTIADHTKAIRIDPQNAVAYFNRGCIYAELGDRDKAIADYSEAIRLHPRDVIPYQHRGVTYSIKGDYDKAIADYTEAIRLSPNFSLVYYQRGMAYKNKGENGKAEADFAEAKKRGYSPAPNER